MFQALKYRLKPLVERSARLQALGQLAMVRFGWFLPHDADYFGLRHMIGKHANRLFVDIGANQGTSVLSFRCFDKETPIVSIEANSRHRSALERLERRDHSFEFRLVACGAVPGELVVYTPVRRSIFGDQVLHTMCSTNREQLEESIISQFGPRFARGVEYEEVRAEVVTLDALELRPSIIKIDTEGAELDVLRGGVETIERDQPFILLEKAEASFAACRELLESRNYQACTYNRARQCFQLDRFEGRNVYFIPRPCLPDLPTG